MGYFVLGPGSLLSVGRWVSNPHLGKPLSLVRPSGATGRSPSPTMDNAAHPWRAASPMAPSGPGPRRVWVTLGAPCLFLSLHIAHAYCLLKRHHAWMSAHRRSDAAWRPRKTVWIVDGVIMPPSPSASSASSSAVMSHIRSIRFQSGALH